MTLRDRFCHLEDEAFRTQNVSIVIDWLQFTGELPGAFFYGLPERVRKGDDPVVRDYFDVSIILAGAGGKEWNHSWKVFYKAEHVGDLFTGNRNHIGSLKETSASYKMENHMMYTDDWYEVMGEVFDSLGFVVNNIRRLDIAIDGLNYLPSFLNLYQKQIPDEAVVDKVGVSRFNAYDYDDKIKGFDKFSMGATKSEKQASIYNKSLEIEEVSQKGYIRDFWRKNGLPIDGNVYRLEMRLRGKMCKDFQIAFDRLTDLRYLAGLMQLGCENLFDFRWHTKDSNVTRRERLNIIPWSVLNGLLLARADKPLTDGVAAAKMAVKSTLEQIYMGRLLKHEIPVALARNEQLGRLYPAIPDWVNKRQRRWEKEWLARLKTEARKNLPPKKIPTTETPFL